MANSFNNARRRSPAPNFEIGDKVQLKGFPDKMLDGNTATVVSPRKKGGIFVANQYVVHIDQDTEAFEQMMKIKSGQEFVAKSKRPGPNGMEKKKNKFESLFGNYCEHLYM